MDHARRDRGLTIEVVSFGGGARAAATVASDAIQVAVISLDGAVRPIDAGQPVRVFYAGIPHVLFEWYARPDIKSRGDLDLPGGAAGLDALNVRGVVVA